MSDQTSDQMNDEQTVTPGVLKPALSINALTKRFAPQVREQTVTITDQSGEEQSVTIRRFTGVAEFGEIGRKIESRAKALKLHKGKLAVPVSPEQIEGLESFFTDAAQAPDGKLAIHLTTDAEIVTATHLEMVVVEPAMTWADAAIFARVAGATAAAIIDQFNRLNTVEAKADAKND